jgi:hypothetical protein
MVVDSLGVDGMSSDESEVDENRQRVFRVKRRPWRSKALDKFLRRIDDDHNTTNAYGNNRAGCQPRIRKRPAYNESTGKAIRNLPVNFYDANWYRKLSDMDKRQLDAQKDVEVPEIE